ncbi:MAG: FAD synthetase family protein [Spirochaetales bacterium]|nr:FAD synthetase family protein [Spirochaetales bacterium]
MELLDWKNLVSGLQERIEGVLTVGVFDGLHLGHQELINAVVTSGLKGEKILITFKNNPASLLRPFEFKGNLLSIRQKLEKIEKLGIERVILIDFSEDFSKIAGREFIKVLMNSINIQKMVIGKDFRFGYHRTIGKENLGNLIMPAMLEVVEPVDIENQKVSSSRIRDLILKGQIHQANQLLGYAFSIDVRQIKQSDYASSCQIYKNAIHQILPDYGEYDAIIEAKTTRFSAKVIMTEEFLNIRTVAYNSCDEIKYITFV